MRFTLAVAVVALIVLSLFPASQRSPFVSRCVTASFLILVILALRRGQSRSSRREERRFWRDLTIAYCSWLAASIFLLGSALLEAGGGGLAAELGAAVFYVFFVRGIERQPHRRSGYTSGLMRRLRLLGVAGFVFGLLTYFVLIPALTPLGSEDSILPAVYFYATLDILLTIRLSYFAWSSNSRRWRALYVLLLAATGAMAAGDLVGSYTSLAEANYLYSVSMIVVILAARLRLCEFPGDEKDRPRSSSGVDSHQSWQSVIYTLTLPLIDLAIYRFGLLDPALRPWRESFVLLWAPLLGAIALLQHGQLEKERKRVVAELEGKNAEMERFTYTVSHDLKSPLVTIQGFLGLLSKDVATGNSDRLESDLQQIKSAAGQMGKLVDDLLELSRAGRSVNQPKDVSLRELSVEAVGLVAADIGKRGIEVEISADLPVVAGDRTRLLQVFQNLVENAVKYMGDQPGPRIEISPRWQGGERVFRVLDNGMGIDPKYQKKVFGLFDRLDTSVEGTGVGLALVERIIEAHDGRVWIESEGEGRGCAVCFTLGAKRDQPPIDDQHVVKA